MITIRESGGRRSVGDDGYGMGGFADSMLRAGSVFALRVEVDGLEVVPRNFSTLI